MTTMMTTTKMSRSVLQSVLKTQHQQYRNISVGTDMISTAISLQKARPWYMSEEEGSNLAKDNAVTMKDLFANKVVALFGVPAPFTGTCTNEHYPGYKALADDLKAAGVDEIVCYSVSDPYAHRGWSRALDNDDAKITFLADPDRSFAKAYGVEATYNEASLGERSIRFSMLVNNGTVVNFHKGMYVFSFMHAMIHLQTCQPNLFARRGHSPLFLVSCRFSTPSY